MRCVLCLAIRRRVGTLIDPRVHEAVNAPAWDVVHQPALVGVWLEVGRVGVEVFDHGEFVVVSKDDVLLDAAEDFTKLHVVPLSRLTRVLAQFARGCMCGRGEGGGK